MPVERRVDVPLVNQTIISSSPSLLVSGSATANQAVTLSAFAGVVTGSGTLTIRVRDSAAPTVDIGVFLITASAALVDLGTIIAAITDRTIDYYAEITSGTGTVQYFTELENIGGGGSIPGDPQVTLAGPSILSPAFRDVRGRLSIYASEGQIETYTYDYTSWLGTETITASTWKPGGNVSISDEVFSDTQSSVNATGTDGYIENQVTSSGGRVSSKRRLYFKPDGNY